MPNFCTKCGKEIENGKAFCSACGAPVKIVENVQESNSFEDSSQRDAPPQSPINQTTSNFTSSNVDTPQTANITTEENVVFCGHCGAKNQVGAGFCGSCGQKI